MPVLGLQEDCHAMDIFITECVSEECCFNGMFVYRVTERCQNANHKKIQVWFKEQRKRKPSVIIQCYGLQTNDHLKGKQKQMLVAGPIS